MADHQQKGTREIHSHTLSAGLPPEVGDRSAWYGAEMAESEEWMERLSEGEIAEVERTVRELEAKPKDLTLMTTEDVPLPTLAPRLERILDEVLNERGFVLIRALPLERWTRREAAIGFSRSEFTSATCGCRMPKDTCSDMSKISDARATIQTPASTRRANAKLITPIHATLLASCVCKPQNPVACQTSYPQPRSSTRCAAAGPTCSASYSNLSKQIAAARFPKARNHISQSRLQLSRRFSFCDLPAAIYRVGTALSRCNAT